MQTALRAFLVVPIFLALLFFAGVAYAQEANTSANTFCKPDAEWDYQVNCGEPVYDAVGNLTGKKGGKDCRCEDNTSCDNSEIIIGKCVNGGVCRATTDCEGRSVKLSPEGEKVELKPGTVLSTPPLATPQKIAPPSLSDTGVVSGWQPSTQTDLPRRSIFEQLLNPEEPSPTPPPQNKIGEFFKSFFGNQSAAPEPSPPLSDGPVAPDLGEVSTAPLQPPSSQISFEGQETPEAPFTAQSTFGQPQTTVPTEKGWLESTWSGVKEFFTPSDVPPATNPEELPTGERTNPSEAELKAAEKQIDNVVKWDLARTDLQDAKDSIEAAQKRNDEQKTILEDSEKQIAQNLKQSDDIRAKAPDAIAKNEATIASLEKLREGLASGNINTIKDATGKTYSGGNAITVVDNALATERAAQTANQTALMNANTYIASWREGPGGYYDAFGNEYATKNLASFADNRAQVESVAGSLSLASDNIGSRVESLEKARSMSFALNDIRYDAFGNEYASARIAAAGDQMELQQSEIALKFDAARTELDKAKADYADRPWIERATGMAPTEAGQQARDALKIAQKNFDTLTTNLKQSDAVVTNLRTGSYPDAVVEKLSTTPPTPEEGAQRKELVAKMAKYKDA